MELFLAVVGGLTCGHALFNMDEPPKEADLCCSSASSGAARRRQSPALHGLSEPVAQADGGAAVTAAPARLALRRRGGEHAGGGALGALVGWLRGGARVRSGGGGSIAEHSAGVAFGGGTAEGSS